MITSNTTKGLIYKVMDYQESSKLLFVYTPTGKKTLVAKGALNLKSSNRLLSQYLTQISFEDSNKDMFSLKDAILINDFSNLKADYDLINLSSKLLLVIDKLITYDLPHKLIYEQVIKVLTAANIIEATYSLLLKLLKPLGFEPTFWQDNIKILGFNISSGMIVTSENKLSVDFSLEELAIIVNYYYLSYEKLSNLNNNDKSILERFINSYYQIHMMHKIF